MNEVPESTYTFAFTCAGVFITFLVATGVFKIAELIITALF